MVEAVKIMVTSFKRSSASTAALSVPDPIAGHCWPMPLPETPGHSWTSLGQSLVGSLLLSPASWCTQDVLFVPSKSLFPQSCVSSGGSMVGLMVTSSRKAYAIPRSAASRVHAPAASHGWPVPPQETPTQQQVWFSLCVLSWCAQGFVCALQASLVGMEFNCKCSFAPSSIFVGLLLYPWTWVIFFLWAPTLFCWWLLSSKL